MNHAICQLIIYVRYIYVFMYLMWGQFMVPGWLKPRSTPRFGVGNWVLVYFLGLDMSNLQIEDRQISIIFLISKDRQILVPVWVRVWGYVK